MHYNLSKVIYKESIIHLIPYLKKIEIYWLRNISFSKKETDS